MAPPKTAGAPRGTIHGSVLSGLVTYTIRAIPLPPKITEFLAANSATMAKMLSSKANDEEQDAPSDIQAATRVLEPEQFWQELEALFKKAGPEWADAADRIWAFGPKRLGANILLDPPGKNALR